MGATEDLINFDLIETHKENIQSLPGGRSARQLASILSPIPSAKAGSEPNLNETKTLNDAIRQEYENELLTIDESDDPLDIYDRYVKWTLNAYPSAQATPQSQLLPLLERATKSFLTSSHYKNDPRYLKLWLHYIRLFSDAPRETFAFLARHHVGETLGLFYEEFATWLESAGRWNQADEVYRMGVEREARPVERLMRKYNQFQQRYEARPQDTNEPSSPALPTVRPALAAKMDPFASAPRGEEQAQRPGSGGSGTKPKSGKTKMAIFNDADSETPPQTATSGTKGWDSIGSMRERKKENVVEAKPWVGETLKAGKRVGTVPKMEIFKDPNSPFRESKFPVSRPGDAINSRTGRSERVFVKLEAVYPTNSDEYSFEELRAMNRGWTNRDWRPIPNSPMRQTRKNVEPSRQPYKSTEPADVENLAHGLQEIVRMDEVSSQSTDDVSDLKAGREKKAKHREVKQETQTVKTRLDSPTGPKIKRKVSASAEPTMTFHSKAAMNDIYNIFNHSKKDESKNNTQSDNETEYDEDTYSTAGESVVTGLISGNNSDFGDETTRSFGADNTSTQPGSVSPWSDFTVSKHVPKAKKSSKSKHKHNVSEDTTENLTSSQNYIVQDGAFDTQAIDALANQDFGDLDTKMIAQLAGDIVSEDEDEDEEEQEEQEQSNYESTRQEDNPNTQEHEAEIENSQLKTPVEEFFDQPGQVEIREKPLFVPIPPEDYEPTPLRTYRDSTALAQNKLPFMTPIAERTESSMAPSTVFQNPDYFNSKTPSRSGPGNSQYESPSKVQVDNLLLGSPVAESPCSSKRERSTEVLGNDTRQDGSPVRKLPSGSAILRPETSLLEAVKIAVLVPESDEAPSKDHKKLEAPLPAKKVAEKARPIHKGPIVLDLQCNPCDPIVRQQILDTIHPAISTYKGYFDSSEEQFNHHSVLKAYASKQKRDTVKSSPKKSQNEKALTKAVPPILKFRNTSRVYAVKKELGKGAYAPVYLVDSYDPNNLQSPIPDEKEEDNKPTLTVESRGNLEAIKTESPPLTLSWEFHVLHLARSRLGDASRAMSSIIRAQECHLYHDECYLILEYHSQGTVLDLVNLVRAENARAGKAAEGLEETVAMWLSVELLRTMDELWQVGLLHGDLKIDNCLVRFDPHTELVAPYTRLGSDGWAGKGLTLIDFGRGIDVKSFKPEAKFVADWRAEETDCAEIREARPWKYEIDLFGAAGIIHSLLFGKYIETVVAGGGGLGQRKEWKLRENLKRYWERDIWSEVFNVLINGGKLNGVEEVRREVARVRTSMEVWLETEGERGGRDLRGAIRRCERLVKSR